MQKAEYGIGVRLVGPEMGIMDRTPRVCALCLGRRTCARWTRRISAVSSPPCAPPRATAPCCALSGACKRIRRLLVGVPAEHHARRCRRAAGHGAHARTLPPPARGDRSRPRPWRRVRGDGALHRPGGADSVLHGGAGAGARPRLLPRAAGGVISARELAVESACSAAGGKTSHTKVGRAIWLCPLFAFIRQ